MAVKKGSSIKGYEDLKGKKVAAKTGTQGADCAESLKDKYGFDTVSYTHLVIEKFCFGAEWNV